MLARHYRTSQETHQPAQRPGRARWAGAAASTGCLPAAVSSGKSSSAPKSAHPEPRKRRWSSKPAEEVSFSRVVDLSHTLHPDFPAWFSEGEEVTTRGKRTFVPPAIVEVKPVFEWEPDRVNLNQITYWEHVGSHMVAPSHFSEGSTVDEIPVEDLVLPLVVIDIKKRAAKDPLALLNVEDVRSWEDEHGPIPERACVAMNSGWAGQTQVQKLRCKRQTRHPPSSMRWNTSWRSRSRCFGRRYLFFRQPTFPGQRRALPLVGRRTVGLGKLALIGRRPDQRGDPRGRSTLDQGRFGRPQPDHGSGLRAKTGLFRLQGQGCSDIRTVLSLPPSPETQPTFFSCHPPRKIKM